MQVQDLSYLHACFDLLASQFYERNRKEKQLFDQCDGIKDEMRRGEMTSGEIRADRLVALDSIKEQNRKFLEHSIELECFVDAVLNELKADGSDQDLKQAADESKKKYVFARNQHRMTFELCLQNLKKYVPEGQLSIKADKLISALVGESTVIDGVALHWHHPKQDLLRIRFEIDFDFASFNPTSFATDVKQITGVDIEIESVKPGSVICNCRAIGGPVAGERIVDHLRDLNAQLNVRSISIADYDIDSGPMAMNPEFNRTYTPTDGLRGPTFQNTFWDGANPDDSDRNDRGDRDRFKYPCPVGWHRFSLLVADFETKCKGWPVCYHGTAAGNAISILSQGFRGSVGCHCPDNREVVYFSPCIEYCGHPRYAIPYEKGDELIQMVLMCRVNPDIIDIKRETQLKDRMRDIIRIHDVIANEEMEWLVRPDIELRDGKKYLKIGDSIVCYGIMVRIAQNKQNLRKDWWQHSKDADDFIA